VPINADIASVKAPRIQALVNGLAINSVIHADIVNSGSCKSSHFELTVSINDSATDNLWLNLPSGRIAVSISVSADPDYDQTIMFEGLAENVAFDPINRVARIQGKDYSSVLVNTTFQNSFCNLTASEIAFYIAARHGFGENIELTTAMVVSYRGAGYNQMLLNDYSRFTSEWDLLVFLAKHEGFEMFVEGTTLIFASATSLRRNYQFIDKSLVIGLKFHKRCPLSSVTTLVVKSWNSWLGEALQTSDQQSSSTLGPSDLGLTTDPGIEFVLVKPNLTAADSERLTQRYLETLNEQQLNIELVMPGEMSLKPGDVITTAGNGFIFDNEYIVKSIRRRFSAGAGFVQYIQGYAVSSNASILLGMVL
jgi:hypothetical protein